MALQASTGKIHRDSPFQINGNDVLELLEKLLKTLARSAMFNQQRHDQRCMVAAPFIHRLHNSGTLPEDGSPHLHTGHLVTQGVKCWASSSQKLPQVRGGSLTMVIFTFSA